MADFSGKRCVVTGAASGLGRDVAGALARAGARLCLADRDGGALDRTARDLAGVEVARTLDVSRDEDVAAFAAEVQESCEAVDVLINAAGILGPAVSVADCGEADWDRVFAVNVKGSYLMVRHILPLMRKAGGGAIVNYASTAGLAGSATLGPYSASKGAVVMMTRSLALAHAGEKIRVNCVCPGSIETPMLDATFASAGGAEAQEERRRQFRARHPLLRFGRPEEVTEAVLYLASDRASFTTGVALPVDGGRLA